MSELSYQLGKCVAEGGSSHVYEILGSPHLLLKTIDSKTRIVPVNVSVDAAIRTIKGQEKLSPDVNLARIVEAGVKNDCAAVVMLKAPGTLIYGNNMSYADWSARVTEFAQVDQRVYAKAVSDAKQIMQAGLAVDLFPGNFFYDPEKGITFIDVNIGHSVPSLQVPFVLYPVLGVSKNNFVNEEDEENLDIITQKLIVAGDFDPSLVRR